MMGLQGFQRCVVMKAFSGKFIGKAVGSGNGFRPKVSGDMGFEHDSMGYFK